MTSLSGRLTESWLLIHVIAIIPTSVHAIIDWHIGLFGASSAVVSPSQAGIAFGMSVLTALWAVGLAWGARGEARGHATAFTVALLWGFFGNGAAIVACLPPCAGGFPYQDLAHVGSLVFGGAAAWASWRQLREAEETPRWLVPGLATVVSIVVFVLESLLTFGWP